MPKSTRARKSRSEASLWMGMDFFAWVRLLARNRFAISFSKLPEVLLITLVAIVNTCFRWLQVLRYGAAVRKIELGEDPIFIIGHWRTGTTMLHELLALDPRNRCPTTYECLSPNHFLLSERIVRRLATWMLPRTRPFDNMKLSFDRPQEDEAALCLRGQPSPFLTVAFPQNPTQEPRYVNLDDLTLKQLMAWKNRLLWFLRLLIFKKPGRLVLKSPQHTFRLPVLNTMFPQAKFIYLVRDPYVVYPSTVHFWTTMYSIYGLQQFDKKLVHEQVLTTFELMHERLEATRQLVSSERFHEMRYESLSENPVEQMELLYEILGLGDFETIRPAVEKYAERSRRYRTNEYELDGASCEAVANRWRAYIQKYGYNKRDSPAFPKDSTVAISACCDAVRNE